MFLGSGCGPALSDEQQAILKQVTPQQFYPLAQLLEMYDSAAKSDTDLLYATGRRWGAALEEELIRRGATNTREALHRATDVYREHHQGDVGQLVLVDDGETAVQVTNNGPHPTRIVAGVFQAIATTFSDVDAQVTISGRGMRISWLPEDQR